MDLAEYYRKKNLGTLTEDERAKWNKMHETSNDLLTSNNINQNNHNLSHGKNSRRFFLIIFVLVLILLGATCPSQEEHRQAVNNAYHEYIAEELGEEDDDVSLMGTALVSNILDFILSDRISVKKYLVFSVGKMQHLDGSSEIISFGILGHVFTIDKADIKERVKQ